MQKEIHTAGEYTLSKGWRWGLCLGLIWILCWGGSGCKKRDKTVRRYQVPKETSPLPVELPTSEQPGYVWDVPQNWTEQPASGMRMATFMIPVSSGEAECSVFELVGQAGGTVENVNRWRRQLGLAADTPESIQAAAVPASGGLGEFSYFRLASEGSEGKAFLVSLMPVDGYTLFVKVACTTGDLAGLEADFLSYCKSIRRP